MLSKRISFILDYNWWQVSTYSSVHNYYILFPIQEEIEAQMKADKIKLALEKLKEAKVKKVRRPNIQASDPTSSDNRKL